MVKAKKAAAALTTTMFVLAGCSETVTHRENIPISHGTVELVITSVSGALGDERYDLKYKNGSEVETFFSGANFSEFSVAQKGEKLNIHLCRGWIDLAQPIAVGEGKNLKIVRLNLDWNCINKGAEA